MRMRLSAGIGAGSRRLPATMPPIGRPAADVSEFLTGHWRGLLRVVERRLEPVAESRFGVEVPRSARFGLELAADVRHVHAQVVRLLAVLRPPHRLEQLTAGDEPPSSTDEDLDDVPLGRGQLDVVVATA